MNQTPGATTGGSSTGWTYDAAGEATNFDAAPGSSSVTGLVWDGLGRMSQVNAPGLTEVEGYAPSGMRVRRDDTRYGQVFLSPGGGGGVSATAIQANLALGTMANGNSPGAMEKFFRGWSTNAGFSIAVAGYGTSTNSQGSTDDYVIGTPAAWLNTSYGFHPFNVGFIHW